MHSCEKFVHLATHTVFIDTLLAVVSVTQEVVPKHRILKETLQDNI